MSNDKKDEKDEEDILIEYPQVVVGMYLVRQNANKIFQDAKFLYDNQRFQTAIPIFVNSIEESLKSQEMAIKFRKKQSISSNEWDKLRLHKHKLTHIANFVIENTESMDDETTKKLLLSAVNNIEESQKQLTQLVNKKLNKADYEKFQKEAESNSTKSVIL